ncbi:MAG: hypothetical protein K5637_00800 [Lachnospiraceae bacterium]|nr:hypothetical protein [Lachnospiraceae bacterium]
MTLHEAESFFKYYEGRQFHMDREDPARAQLYRRMGIPKETEERWLAEIAEEKKRRVIPPEAEYDEAVERLLEEPFHVIDFLPRQVPAESSGQYFEVEAFYRQEPFIAALYRKFADILVSINCYYSLAVPVGIRWARDLDPAQLYTRAAECREPEYLNILLPEEDSLITLCGGDLYMTLYHASDELLETVRQLAASQGLFVRG